jgi:hypothetical protein
MEWIGISIAVVVLGGILYVLFFHKETDVDTLVQRYEKSGATLNADLIQAEAQAKAKISGAVSVVKTDVENANANIDKKVENAVSQAEKKI